jgi:hypothetical protein
MPSTVNYGHTARVSAALPILVVCAVCLTIAGLCVATLRPRLSKHRGAALTFAVPGALVGLSSAWIAAQGELVAVVPVLSISALCFAAAALFVPTAATRFAAFEREFWAHVGCTAAPPDG